MRAYLVSLSNGAKIGIDPDELPRVLEAVRTGRPAIVRQGIFNPSFLVSITDDQKRVEGFLEDTKYNPEKRKAGLGLLEDIFKDMKLLP